MQLDIEELGPVRRRVRVEVPQNRVDSAFSGAYNRIAQRASIPGFRRGRIPMSHLRKRYGRQVITDVTNELLESGFRAVVDDHGLQPLGQPEIDITPARQGKPFVATLTFEIAPHVDLLPFDSHAVEQEKWNASDDVVDHELEHLAERVADFADVEGRTDAQKGDMITFDYRGEIDEVPFPGGTASDARLELGSGQFIPGFEEQVIGHTVGEEFSIEVTFPEDYRATDVAGKKAVFHCNLKGLQAKVTPPIDDELATKVGLTDLADLKTRVKADIERQFNERAAGSAREALRDVIGKAYDFQVPDVLVESGMADKKNELMREAAQAGGDAAEAVDESKLEAHRAEVLEGARAEIVLDQIADEQKIEVSPQEIDGYIEQIIRQTGPYGERFRQVYQDPNRRAGLRRRMRQDKVLDFLLTKANVTTIDKDVPAHDHSHDHDHDHDHDHGDHDHDHAHGHDHADDKDDAE